LRRLRAKSERQIFAPLFPKAELVEDRSHFLVADGQENRCAALILGPTSRMLSKYAVGKGPGVLSVTLSGRLFSPANH